LLFTVWDLKVAVFYFFKDNMPKTKQKKQEISRDIKERLAKSKSVVFTSFNALTVKENEALRNELVAGQAEYYAAKKTLLARTLSEANIEVDARSFDGQVAVTFGYADEVAPAKILAKFVKDTEGRIKFLGGILEGKYIDAAGVTALSILPSKEELYAKIVGSINAPISGFVNVLAGTLRSFVGVLSAIEKTK
jgi:large subunit ribosomal protein L10